MAKTNHASTLLLLLALFPTANAAQTNAGEQVQLHSGQRLVDREIVLADLYYGSKLHVVFSYDEKSNEYGLLQEGLNGESEPLIHGEVESLLDAFLTITPRSVPVPELLLAEAPAALKKMAGRTTTPLLVTARQLELPPHVSGTAEDCQATHYSWWFWHDNATPGLAPRTYSTSEFDGKARYSDSFIRNCTPTGSPSWLWARHRIYYKDSILGWVKHFEGKVAPGGWQEKHKGLARRHRAVKYDDGWDGLPSCGNQTGPCQYTREGRFHD